MFNKLCTFPAQEYRSLRKTTAILIIACNKIYIKHVCKRNSPGRRCGVGWRGVRWAESGCRGVRWAESGCREVQRAESGCTRSVSMHCPAPDPRPRGDHSTIIRTPRHNTPASKRKKNTPTKRGKKHTRWRSTLVWRHAASQWRQRLPGVQMLRWSAARSNPVQAEATLLKAEPRHHRRFDCEFSYKSFP